MKSWATYSIVAALVATCVLPLSACGGGPEETPAAPATHTAVPTHTMLPVPTPTEEASPTPAPTETPVPPSPTVAELTPTLGPPSPTPEPPTPTPPAAPAPLLEPGPWSRHPSNPVMAPGGLGTWESEAVSAGAVVFDGQTYRLWYAGRDGDGVHRVGLATSADGVTWGKHSANPVLNTGETGAWDSRGVSPTEVLMDQTGYRMWYMGQNGAWGIGHATSPDGVDWTRGSRNPVLQSGSAGSWDARMVLTPCVILDGGNYMMWYAGMDDNGAVRIGYAISGDGVTWTKRGPVLEPGPAGSWDEAWVFAPDVVFDGQKYRMWYTGQTGDGRRAIGYAISSDGVSWSKSAGNPVIKGSEAGWERSVMHPHVLLGGTQYMMWYTGIPEFGSPLQQVNRIGLAVAESQ